MRLRPRLAAALLLMPLAVGPAAVAAPPEGCVGLPSVPAAYVCIVSFTPGNATPTVDTGSTTVTVPEICVFACVGPTPVNVPTASVTPNSGTIAVIRYQGQDYPISTSGVPGTPPGSGVPAGFTGHGCSLLAVEDPTQPDTWLGVMAGGPVATLDPTVEIEFARCVLYDGPGDEQDTVAVAPGRLLAKGVTTIDPTVATFGYDADTATLRYCLHVLWRYDSEPNVHYGELVCATPAGLGTARLVV